MEQTHSQHTMKLQHSLREEAEGRQAAERALTELRGEVSIGMEDTSTLTPAQGRGENLGLFLFLHFILGVVSMSASRSML